MSLVDAWIATWLLPLAVWLLISGLDDLLVDLAWLQWRRRRSRDPQSRPPTEADLDSVEARRVALFIPLWQEHRVIGRMLERNLTVLRYERYEVFAGCYPNDPLTVASVEEAARRHSQVHVALCPHDGPTSKADCLNWIYQRMLLYEEQRGVRFDLIVVHDAEDLMHPDELRWANYYAEHYDMVQIPVLPLSTGAREFTHGVYCDEFAEYQSKDVPVRLSLGAFLPSNGVGTAYRRSALERLAVEQANRLFDPRAMTEDYAIGLRLHQLGCRQLFIPIRFLDGSPLATREYFPRRFAAAVRQRTRWVLGIALQSWEEFGWQGKPAQVYFLWRDRKGLLGNPLSCLGNAIFLYGAVSWGWSWLSGEPWGLGLGRTPSWVLGATLMLQCWRMGVRMACTARIYGWRSALWSPLRIFWANAINFAATTAALQQYAVARCKRRPPAWLKTEHMYPSRAALLGGRTLLGELLVRAGLLSREELDHAVAAKPAHLRLGEYLVRLGRLSERDIYSALSLQQELPLARLHPQDVPRLVARTLPAALVRRWKVLPFKVSCGSLFVAGPEPPTEALEQELRKFTRLEVRFHLLPPSDFERLRMELIETPAGAERAGDD